MSRKTINIAIGFLLLLSLAACEQGVPKEALQLSPDSLQRRQLQTRVFETEDEKQLLSASATLLQDLGFNLDESETELGIIVASKDRDATKALQDPVDLLWPILIGIISDDDDELRNRASLLTRRLEQRIRASLVTRRLEDRNGYAVRLTMQRIVWAESGQVSKTEPLDEPEIYQEFFAKLSKSVFLEAQGL